jgi:enamine deaminase RidA (YjgF/YER057c/UK114 family)
VSSKGANGPGELTRAVNPWKWQDDFGFSQAIEVQGPARWLVCSGQTSVDAQGNPMHAGDMAAQLRQAFDNLETVLQGAGLTLGDVVRLNYYTTNVAAYLQASVEVARRFTTGRPPPAGTLLGVAALFHPDILIEIEATACAASAAAAWKP